MPIGSIWLITMQKVLKTQSVESMEQHYLGSNQILSGCELYVENIIIHDLLMLHVVLIMHIT